MSNVLIAVVVLLLVLAIYLTTPGGQRLLSALGLHRFVKDAAPAEDRAYMLRVCGGDHAEVERRLQSERARNDALSEAQVYRKAIRRLMNERKDDA